MRSADLSNSSQTGISAYIHVVHTESNGRAFSEMVIRHIENGVFLVVITPVIGFGAKALGYLFRVGGHLSVKSSPHHGQYRGIVSNSVQLVI